MYTSSLDKEKPTDGLHATNVIEKITASTAKLCSDIKNRGDNANALEKEFFVLVGKFFEEYIASFTSDSVMMPAIIGALIQRHESHTKALIPAWEVLKSDVESAAFAQINTTLNLFVQKASEVYRSSKDENTTPFIPVALDLINGTRYEQDFNAHRFVFYQKQLGKLDSSILFNEQQRESFRKSPTFSIRIHSIKATKLTAFDSNGLSDPFVTFSQSDEIKFKTKKIKKELNPEWTFGEKDDAKIEIKPYFEWSTIKVMDWDLIGKNETMCEFIVSFVALRAFFTMGNEINPNDQFTLILRDPRTVKKKDTYKVGMEGELTIVFSFL
jgi:hypothetical protein